jgi:hypothetical protein
MKNTLSDLNDLLFEEIKRLGNEEMVGDKLMEEVCRAKSISEIAGRVIDNGALVLDAHKARASATAQIDIPMLLG